MLINCPKCNFSQPKETYCAKCGIEMDAYLPEKKPFFISFIKNPVVHIVLFLIAIFLGYTTYQHQTPLDLDSSNLSQDLAPIKSKKQDHAKIAKEPPDQTAPNEINNSATILPTPNQNIETAQATLNKLNADQNNSDKITINARAAAITDADQSEQSSVVTTGSWTLQVRYIQALSSDYQQWMTEAQRLDAYAEMGDYAMGKVIKNQKTFGKNIDSSTKTYSDLKTSKVFLGNLNGEGGSELTINFKFNLTQDPTGAFQGDFDINEDDGANKKQFASSFEMKSTELLFIRSVTPHRPGKSESSDSEFLIIFDFQSSH